MMMTISKANAIIKSTAHSITLYRDQFLSPLIFGMNEFLLLLLVPVPGDSTNVEFLLVAIGKKMWRFVQSTAR
jgi:hypothetical protein